MKNSVQINALEDRCDFIQNIFYFERALVPDVYIAGRKRGVDETLWITVGLRPVKPHTLVLYAKLTTSITKLPGFMA